MKRVGEEQNIKNLKRFKSSSSSDEVESIQDKSTDYVEDTSDTSTLDVEYEVADIGTENNLLFSTSEESELQDIAELGAVVAAVAYDSNFDIGLYADTSEACSTSPTSNSDVDPGLPRTDYLDFTHCAKCKIKLLNTNYPYCSICFQERKLFYPPRPRRRKQLSQESGVGMSLSDSLTDQVDGPTKELPQIAGSSKEKCSICFIRPINGLFVHGQTAHRYSCYQCAKKTWATVKACPLCRRPIKNVLRMLNVDS